MLLCGIWLVWHLRIERIFRKIRSSFIGCSAGLVNLRRNATAKKQNNQKNNRKNNNVVVNRKHCLEIMDFSVAQVVWCMCVLWMSEWLDWFDRRSCVNFRMSNFRNPNTRFCVLFHISHTPKIKRKTHAYTHQPSRKIWNEEWRTMLWIKLQSTDSHYYIVRRRTMIKFAISTTTTTTTTQWQTANNMNRLTIH